MQGVSILTVLYLIIGLIVAANRGYLVGLHSLAAIFSAVLAILLWPLVLIGLSVHISVTGIMMDVGNLLVE